MAVLSKMRNVDILSYAASDPKYESYLAIIDVLASYSFQSMISQCFIPIGSHLSDFSPFYGPKFPRKSSFSLYNIQLKYSNSLNRSRFVSNVVFFYSIGTPAKGYGQIKNLQIFLLLQNRIFLSPTPKL